ncbi:MAG: flippase [Bacteroides thetaiotaomicron]|uniref:Flippase n=1 Tax=Bacteroides thetaiotaomicron TaxID=818 RepID=A0A943DTI6_BACT4|nr:flippase [Bacteroides thetaiotaomicron]
MTKNKSLGVNALLNGIRTVLNLLFPIITFPYVSRVLQVENIGKYNFALSLNQYFLLIAALGITTYAIREGTKYRDQRKEFDQFASEIFSINLVSTIVAYLLMVICLITVPKFYSYRLIILIFSIELIFTTIGTEWIFSIFEEYAYITIRSIVFKIVSIILLLVLVRKPEDYIIYAGITVFANAGSNILNFIHAKKYCQLRITLDCNWRKHIAPILVIFASTMATSIYVNSDMTMLGFMATNYEVGIYSVSSKVYRIVKMMLSSVLVVSIPRLALLMGQNRMGEYKKTLMRIFNVLTILVLPAVVGLYLLSKEIVLLISDATYIQAVTSLQLLSIALAFCIFGWIFNQCVLIPAKKEKIVLIATIVSAIANIVINFVLIPVWKENAAAFSTVVAEAIMMIICLYYGLKVVRLNSDVVNNIVTVALGCIVVSLICILIRQLGMPDIFTLCISVFASVLGYSFSLILFRNRIALEFTKKVFIRLKK